MMALEGAQAKIWTALPGIVAAVDLDKQTVSVQPTIRGRVTGQNGSTNSVNMPLLVDVPIVFPRAGGFALTFPVAVGDEALVVFACRAIDSWWQSGNIGEPVEARMHDLSDGFAILGPTSQAKKLTGVSASNVQLRNEDGDTFVELTPSGAINITAPGNVAVSAGGNASITAGGNATVTAAGSAAVNGASVAVTGSASIDLTAPIINLNGAVGASQGISATGNITTTGSISADQDITSDTDVLADGISLKTHVHGGVVSGGANTGAPV